MQLTTAVGQRLYACSCRYVTHQCAHSLHIKHFCGLATARAPIDSDRIRIVWNDAYHTVTALQGQIWVRLEIIGQSFMLHQIRKMVGLAVALYRNAAPAYVLPAALSPANNVHVPLAPEGGLYLERCIFDAYNARWSEQHGGPLDVEQYAEQTAAFKVSCASMVCSRHFLVSMGNGSAEQAFCC